jgi:hypothetical protein
MTPDEMVRRVLDLIRDGKLDRHVIRLSAACRDRMREQDWYLRQVPMVPPVQHRVADRLVVDLRVSHWAAPP